MWCVCVCVCVCMCVRVCARVCTIFIPNKAHYPTNTLPSLPLESLKPSSDVTTCLQLPLSLDRMLPRDEVFARLLVPRLSDGFSGTTAFLECPECGTVAVCVCVCVCVCVQLLSQIMHTIQQIQCTNVSKPSSDVTTRLQLPLSLDRILPWDEVLLVPRLSDGFSGTTAFLECPECGTVAACGVCVCVCVRDTT